MASRWSAWLILAASLAVTGCDISVTAPTNIELKPENFAVAGTTWVGAFNDVNGRGVGTLTIAFDQRPEARNNKLHGNWRVNFSDSRFDTSGPAHRNYNFGDGDSISLFLDVPDRSAGGAGCWMAFYATRTGTQMAGTIITGYDICTALETKRLFAATLTLQ